MSWDVARWHLSDLPQHWQRCFQKRTTKKAASLKVKLVKSTIGSKKDQIATVEALGLHKVGDVRIQPDNAQTRDKINKVIHLVEVKEAKA